MNYAKSRLKFSLILAGRGRAGEVASLNRSCVVWYRHFNECYIFRTTTLLFAIPFRTADVGTCIYHLYSLVKEKDTDNKVRWFLLFLWGLSNSRTLHCSAIGWAFRIIKSHDKIYYRCPKHHGVLQRIYAIESAFRWTSETLTVKVTV